MKPTLVCTDSDELKEFISRPALKYCLRFLTGLATDHEPTQVTPQNDPCNIRCESSGKEELIRKLHYKFVFSIFDC